MLKDLTILLYRARVFSDFYAYDDGTAEAGFRLSAPGGGSCALRYSLNFADTLRAVHFFFVKGVEDVSGREFYLRIWGPDPADPTKPGTMLYERRALFPQYGDSLNEFVTYTVDSTFQLPVGNFFVGWYQPQDYALNVGYDRNTNHGDVLYYKVANNGWQQNSIDGSLMMRPVVGDSIINPLGIGEPATARNTSNIYLYPNPAADRVFIANAAEFGPKPVTYTVFNMQGLLIDTGKLTNALIDISNMTNGLYFVRFDGNNFSTTRKLIIAR
ncbi:MAG: T9SS type A sorting domain-containing protein [Sphingobacteriales bacterium JAD_PAG50586_3]|nr:MAG: T9SS type A sorting domain-containing protein [Sphingobacteriales bacterium JAD_PAG50586_3]